MSKEQVSAKMSERDRFIRRTEKWLEEPHGQLDFTTWKVELADLLIAVWNEAIDVAVPLLDKAERDYGPRLLQMVVDEIKVELNKRKIK